VDELGAKLDRNLESRHAARPAPPADALACLENQNGLPCVRQLRAGGKSSGAGADDDYVAGRRVIPL
jgi:hypothetical protein